MNVKRMMRVICLCLTLVASMITTASAVAYTNEDMGTNTTNSFFIKKVRYDNGGRELSYSESSALRARYSDTKTPIPMSEYYDGWVFAIVPEYNRDREIEYFSSSPLKFSDEINGWEHVCFKELSASGVIKGDGEGRLDKGRVLTLSEAVSVLVRAIGVEDAFTGKIPDISSNSQLKASDWYYPSVYVAAKYSIIDGPIENFDPHEPVSREEFTVMTQRAFKSAGLLNEVPEGETASLMEHIADRDNISEFAVSSYASLYYNNGIQLVEYIWEDASVQGAEPTASQYAFPKQYVTRENAFEIVWDAIRWLPVFPSNEAMERGFDVEMPVIDGSTSTYPYTNAVYNRLFHNGTQHPQYPKSHSKSYTAYQRLIDGEIDMLFASVYPSSDILELAGQKGVELELVPIAYDAQVFFTNSANTLRGLSIEQISDIYVNNAYDNWNQVGGPDAKLIPFCRNNDSGSHAQMERYFLKGNQIHEDVRVENTSLTMSDILTQVENVSHTYQDTYALGYSIYYYYHNVFPILFGCEAEGNSYLKLLAIEGVMPNDDTIADGSYPLSNNSYVVFRKGSNENSVERKMADFMLSELGQECVIQAGYGPLKQ